MGILLAEGGKISTTKILYTSLVITSINNLRWFLPVGSVGFGYIHCHSSARLDDRRVFIGYCNKSMANNIDKIELV